MGDACRLDAWDALQSFDDVAIELAPLHARVAKEIDR